MNITRSKSLINKIKRARSAKTQVNAVRCNHCGGPVRANGDIQSCLMCSRDVEHLCANCSHPRERPQENQKSA